MTGARTTRTDDAIGGTPPDARSRSRATAPCRDAFAAGAGGGGGLPSHRAPGDDSTR